MPCKGDRFDWALWESDRHGHASFGLWKSKPVSCEGSSKYAEDRAGRISAEQELLNVVSYLNLLFKRSDLSFYQEWNPNSMLQKFQKSTLVSRFFGTRTSHFTPEFFLFIFSFNFAIVVDGMEFDRSKKGHIYNFDYKFLVIIECIIKLFESNKLSPPPL